MQTYALQLTATGVGAIAVILLAGEHAGGVLQKICASPKVNRLRPGEFARTRLHAAGQTRDSAEYSPASMIDDALIVYTQKDRFELHLHGGIAVVAAVLAALESAGATIISLHDARALGLLGRGISAEIQAVFSSATTLTAVRLLANQSTHGIAQWAKHWTGRISSGGDDALWRVQSAAQWLLARSASLNRLRHPPRIALLGAPNVGKSTLANALLGRPVSITSNLAGTTRDWVDARTVFTAAESGKPPVEVPVTLVDTAGIRETTDLLEQQSISRTHEQAAAAEVLILLFDATQPPSAADLQIMDSFRDRPLVLAFNKIDALSNSNAIHLSALFASLYQFSTPVPLSAKSRQGIDTLMAAVLDQLDLSSIDPREPFAFTPRQQGILSQIAQAPDAPTSLALFANLME